MPSSYIAQSEISERQKSEDDEEKLQHLVIDRGTETTQKSVRHDNARREEDAEIESPPKHLLAHHR